MALKSEQRIRTRSILVTIIVASVACYCVGVMFLQVGNGLNQPTKTPTITTSPTLTYTSAPPLTLPSPVIFPSATPTATVTETWTPTVTYTPFATRTRTITATSTTTGTATMTATKLPPTETNTLPPPLVSPTSTFTNTPEVENTP